VPLPEVAEFVEDYQLGPLGFATAAVEVLLGRLV
jgi:hypothetical protein